MGKVLHYCFPVIVKNWKLPRQESPFLHKPLGNKNRFIPSCCVHTIPTSKKKEQPTTENERLSNLGNASSTPFPSPQRHTHVSQLLYLSCCSGVTLCHLADPAGVGTVWRMPAPAASSQPWHPMPLWRGMERGDWREHQQHWYSVSHLPLGSCLYILEELKQDAYASAQALFLTLHLPFCYSLQDQTTSFLYSTGNYLLQAAHEESTPAISSVRLAYRTWTNSIIQEMRLY